MSESILWDIFNMQINEGQHWVVNSEHTMKQFKDHIDALYAKDKYIVIKWATGKQRSLKQNSALHVWCQLMADELNAAGYGMEKVLEHKASIDWTMTGVKEHLWKPVQEAMTGKDSTSKAHKVEYIKVFETLNRHFGDKMGIHVPWPTYDTSNN
tara:strand:- start:1001 stop:1462 length:462 start_codon:yes stop_codon:yes gene_type:complete